MSLKKFQNISHQISYRLGKINIWNYIISIINREFYFSLLKRYIKWIISYISRSIWVCGYIYRYTAIDLIEYCGNTRVDFFHNRYGMLENRPRPSSGYTFLPMPTHTQMKIHGFTHPSWTAIHKSYVFSYPFWSLI